MFRLLAPLFLTSSILFLVSCGSGDDFQIAYSGIVIETDSKKLKTGENIQLVAYLVSPNNQKEIATERANWSVSDESIATIDDDKTLHAHKSGFATISVNLEEHQATLDIEVFPNLIQIEVTSHSNSTLTNGNEYVVAITALFEDGTSRDVTAEAVYKVKNSGVVILKDPGVFQTRKVGTSVITIEYGNFIEEITLNVISPPDKIELSNIDSEIEIGQIINPDAELVLSDGNRQMITDSAKWFYTTNSFRQTPDGLQAQYEGLANIEVKFEDLSDTKIIRIIEPLRLYIGTDIENKVELKWKTSKTSPTRIYWNTTGDVNSNSSFFDITGLTSYTHNDLYRNTRYYYRLAKIQDGAYKLGTEVTASPRLNQWYQPYHEKLPFSDQTLLIFDTSLITMGGFRWENGTRIIYDYVASTNLETLQTNSHSNIPLSRANMAACTDNKLIYTFGGNAIGQLHTTTNHQYNPSNETWITLFAESPETVLEPLPEGISGGTCHVHDDIVYVFGGLTSQGHSSKVYAYDINNNVWEEKTPMFNARRDFSSTLVDNIVYVIGGANDEGLLSTVEAFDILTNSWTKEIELPINIAFHAASRKGDLIYISGGIVIEDPNQISSYKLFTYNIKTKKLTEKDSLVYERGDHSSYIVGNTLYIYGGANTKNINIEQIETFDLATEDVFPKAPIPFRASLFATASVDSDIYFFGGDRTPPSSNVDKLHLGLNFWQNNVSTMKQPLFGIDATTVNNEIYIFGGINSNKNSINTLEKFNPKTTEWTTMTAPPISGNFSGLSIANNIIYKMGGNTSSAEALSYDTVTNTWTELPNLPTPRSAPLSVTLGNYIYVIGGTFNYTTTNAVERYNTKLNNWETVSPLSHKRYSATGTVINGKIYVFGGLDENALDSVEVFDPLTETWSDGPQMPSKRSLAKGQLVDGNFYILGGFPADSNEPHQSIEIFR